MEKPVSTTINKVQVAIILINYNGSDDTAKCVENILLKTSKTLSYEITVIDNASKRDDFEALQNLLRGVNDNRIKLYRSKINTGFGGGNMMGVQHANADYYLFLNNDTLLTNDAVSICRDFMEKTADAAVCGAQIYDQNEKPRVSFDHFTSFGREVFGKSAIEFLNPKSKPKRRKIYADPLEVDYVNGSFMFFRASDFKAVGGFDTNLFLYFEESDICCRLRRRKRKTYFLPAAKYLHYQGKSIDRAGMPIDTKIELKTSMFYVIRKNNGYVQYQLLRLFFIIRYGLVSLFKPKYWKLFHRILIGLPLGKSLKQRQVIED